MGEGLADDQKMPRRLYLLGAAKAQDCCWIGCGAGVFGRQELWEGEKGAEK